MATATEPFRPHVFGKFYLLQKLGQGGMAEIYRAKVAGSGGFEKELAVKRILPGLSSDSQFARMLINEAKLTVALAHPTIAQVYELGEIDGLYFISMELVEGATLHDVLFLASRAGKPLTIEQSIYVCLEILRGLEYAHKRTDGAGNPLGIVHCDVSPDNVMINWDGGVKLLDFGVARAAHRALSNYKEGTLMGKLSYASPEQAEGEGFDHRVDLFAVGVIFYELLTGTHPFGRVQTVDALIASRKKKVVPPSKVRAELPPFLDEFVLKSLSHSVSERFQSAKEMGDELVDFLFPTPTQSVAEHLSVSMKELYKERIERQQRLRANDSLHMKVLANAMAKAEESKSEAIPAAAPMLPEQEIELHLAPTQGTKIFVSALDTSGMYLGGSYATSLPQPSARGVARPRTRQRPLPISRPAPSRWRMAAAWGAGLAIGAAAILGFRHWATPPPLVVLSEPAGAEVIFEGQTLGTTPLILARSPLPRKGAQLLLQLSGYRDTGVQAESVGGNLLQARAALPSSLGSLRIESHPPGARVLVNGEAAGTTPLELDGIPLDEAYRFELELRGYEPDSFVRWPDDPEPVIRRTLQRAP